MRNLWFITNIASGSATTEKAAAIEAIFAERGLSLTGRTNFPEDDLPESTALHTAEVDTVVLFAGDGTINAAVCALAEWDGAILILPGGTMNLLAKRLHGPADPATIIQVAHDHGRCIALPFVEAGKHRGLVGMIMGPAASWVLPRELVRAGRIRGLGRAILAAWRRTFSRGIRLEGIPDLRHHAQAIFVRPGSDHLDVAAVDARDWRAIASLGWEWVTGDWVAAAQVTQVRTKSFRVAGRRRVLALFDGEPVMLDPSTRISGGATREMFLSTLETA